MYVILVYDFGERRVSKMLRLCRRYLNWIQNSVFEGELSEVRLKELLLLAKGFMNPEEDCIIIFKGATQCSLEKEIVGKELSNIDNFCETVVEVDRYCELFNDNATETLYDVLIHRCLAPMSLTHVFILFLIDALFLNKSIFSKKYLSYY